MKNNFSKIKPEIRLTEIAILLSTFLLLFGCTTTLKTYPGPELPRNQIAVLLMEDNIKVTSLDGKALFHFATKLELLPGLHWLTVEYFSAPFYSTRDIVLSFQAEPGHTYRIWYDINILPGDSRGTWNAWIEDVTK